MKSHMIPDPTPLDRNIRETDAARYYLLDQEQGHGEAKTDSKEDYPRMPEMPMRNFLRVVFVR
jgi:hypothetical protein